MKVRIEKEFVDKITNETYKVGTEVEFEKARADELLKDSRELVSAVKEAPKKTTKATKEVEKVEE